MASLIARFALQCSIAALAAGCGSGGGDGTCQTDDQCPSHFCRADGTCAPDVDAPPSSDAGPDGGSGLCTPNHDGQISAGELPLIAGRAATFRVATDATWSTAGVDGGAGARTWDLSAPLSGDADAVITLSAPAAAWWAGDFPTASYAAPLASSSSLLGVFAVDDAGVTMLGVVSPAAGATRTELSLNPPAQILAVPFGVGSSWTSTSTVSGIAQGVIVDYAETYASEVDHAGTMTTPYGPFPVLRVATDLTRSEGATPVLTNRTFAWVAECFGAIANVRSQDYESAAEFSDDAEVRRLAP